MASAVVLRSSSGSEKHVATLKNTDNYVIHYALDGDRADFGGAAAGSAPQVLDAAGAGVMGTFRDCTDKQAAIFKIEYSVAGQRQFRVWVKDFNATIGIVPLPMIYSPRDTGITTNVLETGYRHAEGIVVPVVGFKEVTLELLSDGLTTPAVSAWLATV